MLNNSRSTIGLKKDTKDRLDQNRAPGQCYDGFICQLVDLWEKLKENKQDYALSTSRGGDAYKNLNQRPMTKANK